MRPFGALEALWNSSHHHDNHDSTLEHSEAAPLMNSVKQFFGAAEEPKPAYSILGAGRRGSSAFDAVGGSRAVGRA